MDDLIYLHTVPTRGDHSYRALSLSLANVSGVHRARAWMAMADEQCPKSSGSEAFQKLLPFLSDS